MRSALLLFCGTMAIMEAAPYSVVKKTVDQVEVYVLRDEAADVEVRVAPSVGNNSYAMTVHGKRVFWSPYQTVGEFAAKPVHLGNPLLWPWANRIDGVSYWANGQHYLLNNELGNLKMNPANAPIHGLLLFSKLWQVKEARADARGAFVTSRLEFWRYAELMAQFPFAHAIEMTYRLQGGVLEVETAIENLGAQPMPVSLGFHPYFALNDAPRDEWRVHLAAQRRLKLSPRLIPTGETEPNPYADPQPLKGGKLDDVFDQLVRDADGFARFWVEGQRERLIVEYGPNYHVAVVYAPPGRDFICFEPMTGPTNAFNAAHDGWYKDLQSIAPGATWREVFRVKTAGF